MFVVVVFFFAYAFRAAFCSIYVCNWRTKQTLIWLTQDPIKMEYTSEQLNYFRFCYITFKLVPEGLRTVFKQEWDFLYKATAIGEWKDTPQNGLDFYNNETRKSRARNARLLATIRRGNTAEWDCSCLFFAILYSDTVGSTLSPGTRKEVDDLRQVRNDVAGINVAQLTDAQFDNYVGRVLASFTSLSLPINEVQDIKNEADYPTAELNALKVQVDNLKADLQTKDQEAKNLASELQSKMKELTLTHEINSKVESFCTLTLKPSHPIIRRVNDVTRITKKLDELQNESKGAISIVYLSGLPGCGKSQIARQVGKEIFDKRLREGEDLTFVATLNAETLDSLAESYNSLARHLGITVYALTKLGSSRNLRERIEYLKALIFSKTKQFSNWLIIVDNVVDLSSVRDDLPASGTKEWGHGQVLITTQDISSIPVNAPLTYHESLSKGMHPDEAVNLLRHLSNIQNQEEAEKVAEVLEYQPLALVDAAFYVRTAVVNGSPNYSWANYLKKFRRRGLDVIGAYPESQKPLVPSEIKARGRKAMLAYKNALETGKVKVYRARIMFIGQDRAGKTSLKNSFLGLPFDREQQSTDGIEMDPSKFEVVVDQVSNWKRTDEKQGVSKFVHKLVRMVAGKLEHEEIEVDPAQEKTVSQVSVFK